MQRNALSSILFAGSTLFALSALSACTSMSGGDEAPVSEAQQKAEDACEKQVFAKGVTLKGKTYYSIDAMVEDGAAAGAGTSPEIEKAGREIDNCVAKKGFKPSPR